MSEPTPTPVRKYSDPLLMFIAKAKLPAYRDVSRVEGSITHKLDAGVLGTAVADVAARIAAGIARPAIAAPSIPLPSLASADDE